ncbi:hypothetical protein ACIBAG_02380 [Streptomyces sp. NPDC051243]|uniref:hypothetical protein n=1 Tax=Streptomyces sp. NPDC051243 TaxID=3365646 RepID=UPI00379B988B
MSGKHVRQAVCHCVKRLTGVPAAQWHLRAGGLEWTCRETLEHHADDLLTYALRFGLTQPMNVPRVPLRISRDRPEGPANVIFGDEAAGPEGLLTVVEACGGLLATVVDPRVATRGSARGPVPGSAPRRTRIRRPRLDLGNKAAELSGPRTQIKKWPAEHPRFHLPFTLTGSSWATQVTKTPDPRLLLRELVGSLATGSIQWEAPAHVDLGAAC